MNIFKSIVNEIRETYRFRYVISNFVKSTLKLRYQRTTLGFFWSVLGPMMHYLVVGLVFSYTMKGSIPNYAAFMFAGALYYNIFSGVAMRSPGILLANEHFIKKIYIPKLVFILDTVFVEIINFLLSLCALLILGLCFGRITLSVHFFFVPYALLLIFLLTIGTSSILGVAGVYFRDFAHIVPVLLQALFFVTPILYKPEFMPEDFQVFIRSNPLSYYVEIFRDPIVYNVWPNSTNILYCSFFSFSIFITGLFIIKRFENRIVFRL